MQTPAGAACSVPPGAGLWSSASAAPTERTMAQAAEAKMAAVAWSLGIYGE